MMDNEEFQSGGSDGVCNQNVFNKSVLLLHAYMECDVLLDIQF